MVFLGGLLVGFPFAFFVVGEISLWPIPLRFHAALPGTERAWRMAHLEGILNGLTLIAVAGVGRDLALGERAQKWVAYGLVVTAWANLLASVLGPVFGGRGLAIGAGFEEHGANAIMFVLFVAAIVTVMAAMVLVVRGVLRSPER